MVLKDVQYVYAEELTHEERSDLGITDTRGLFAIETTASKLKRTPKPLKDGIISYIWSLKK